MKKFKDGEIFHNTIKAYPKVEFFANGGVVHYGRQNYPAASTKIPVESVGIFNFPNPPYAGPPPPVVVALVIGAILTEADGFLLAESGDNLIIES